jgi:dolichyl-diphosphooligosaccharide--protein glycosyltransferase/undecaprenyl-diphosphooligosaccharide--protein glycosyltransferase
LTQLSKDTKLTLLYILIAFSFSVALRLIWIYQFGGYEPFYFNGQFMINTNDGYIWAEGARDLISGISQPNDLSPTTQAPSQLTAFLAKILPVSFETLILYMPVFLSSLIVVPIILIAKGLKNLEMGLIAALLGSVAWSYYNRTMVGYYDTDMLNIVLPMFLLWSIIWAIQTKEEKYLLFAAVDILIYRWWYPQSYSLELSFFGLILVYTLIFDRKNAYNYKLLAIMMFAMINLDAMIRLLTVVALYFAFKQEKLDKYVYALLALSAAAFLASGGFNPVWAQLKGYVFKDARLVSDAGLNLHYFSVMQTVREAGQIPFSEFANRISGHVITFVLSLVGFIYLAYRHKIMLFALPLIGLGFLASVGGLRFTIYAVPVLAFGVAFLITELARVMPTQKLKFLSMLAFTLAILYPNYKHIDEYKVPTVMNADEVKVLDALKTIADREDYVVAWWDYGYPIRYYADVKTLVDGGKHDGDVNFPVSFILTNPSAVGAKMARLDVEYTEKTFAKAEENRENNLTTFSYIEQMTTDYGFKDTNDFLLSLETPIELPKKTRDIYFYLPFNMLNIYPTVTRFSYIDLMNGKEKPAPFYFISRNFRDVGSQIQLNQEVFMDKQTFTLTLGSKKVTPKRFVKTFYNEKMQLQKEMKIVDMNSDVNIVYMSNYNTFLLLDDATYNSLYIQLMVLEEYDKNIFEQVALNPHAKVYKLKI